VLAREREQPRLVALDDPEARQPDAGGRSCGGVGTDIAAADEPRERVGPAPGERTGERVPGSRPGDVRRRGHLDRELVDERELAGRVHVSGRHPPTVPRGP
jgi:hypothetical protein